MDSKQHMDLLGTLVTNIQALETVLRLCLLAAELPEGTPGPKYHELAQGQLTDCDAFTDYKSLAQLITAYNGNPLSVSLTIDETLVDIRDAIAHGRVYAPEDSGISQLLKFGPPKDGQVVVEYSASMTGEWFMEQRRRFRDAVVNVYEAIKRLQRGVSS